MTIQFGRDICGQVAAESREWLVTNGIGGYASGAVSGLLTRRYHGLLLAALHPPVGRTLLVSKLDEVVQYGGLEYELATNRWADGTISPHGYRYLQQFQLEGTIPRWTFACADVLLEKRVWMQQGANTTYVRYTVKRCSGPVGLSVKALINYRDHHADTQADDWQMQVESVAQGVRVRAFPEATPFFLRAAQGQVTLQHTWYRGFDLAAERYRGLRDRDDHLHAATWNMQLQAGESWTVVLSTEPGPNLDGATALVEQQTHTQSLLDNWRTTDYLETKTISKAPHWIQQLVLAADQFIVQRPLPEEPDGRTVIAGYPWFGDWGRDTMISLPGLAITTGRPEIAKTILRTFTRYLDQGMLPNVFPEAGAAPRYNTVDAILWYFEAIRAYTVATGDLEFVDSIFPALEEVIHWHRFGTRYSIHLDDDGLIYAGEPGVQLTWMDAKVEDWVVTPRIGKPVEINALWYNALGIMEQFAQQLGQSRQDYTQMAQQTHQGFQRFWSPELDYCYDVLDGPEGHDAALRPNQLFAISLAMTSGTSERPSLLSAEQQQEVVYACSRLLLTSHGLRSLSPDHPQYQGHYSGNQLRRDGVYHQGTVWGWLLGPFAQAHFRVYKDAEQALAILEPMADHLQNHGVGSLSEIFDGEEPFTPRGCIAQAWSVAEVLRVWLEIASRANA